MKLRKQLVFGLAILASLVVGLSACGKRESAQAANAVKGASGSYVAEPSQFGGNPTQGEDTESDGRGTVQALLGCGSCRSSSQLRCLFYSNVTLRRWVGWYNSCTLDASGYPPKYSLYHWYYVR